MNKFVKTIYLPIAGLLLCISFFAYLSGPSNSLNPGFFIFLGQTSLDFFILFLALKLFFQEAGNVKNDFIYIFFSFLCAFVADFSYNLIVNVFQISKFSIYLDSIFDLPFLFFLFFQVIFWYRNFKNIWKVISNKWLFTISPVLLIAGLTFSLFVFGDGWQIGHFSILGLYQIVDTLFESLCVVLISINLATSKNKTTLYLAIGSLIIISSDYIIRAGVVANSLLINSFMEITWMVGQLFILFGLSIKNLNNNNKEETHYFGLNTIQSQIALWSLTWNLFLILVLCLFIPGLTNELTSSFSIKHLPSILIMLSTGTIIISTLSFRKFLKPLKSLNLGIADLIHEEKLNKQCLKAPDYGIFEYIELKKLLINSSHIIKTKIESERKLARFSIELAHDIRSPIAVLQMLSHKIETVLDKEDFSILQEVLLRIRNIANNLLANYRTDNLQNYSAEHGSIVDMQKLIAEIVDHKNIELGNLTSLNVVNSQSHDLNYFIKGSECKLYSIISNLINNAYEANLSSPKINIKLENKTNQIFLQIDDNGLGISEEHKEKILNGFSTKHSGEGFGVATAKKYIEAIGGQFILDSIVGMGTQITLIFPNYA